MASNTYTRTTADGKTSAYSRKGTQGRRPSGLGKPKLIRLRKDSEDKMKIVKENLGYLYNENDLIRSAVEYYLNNVYTELLKH